MNTYISQSIFPTGGFPRQLLINRIRLSDVDGNTLSALSSMDTQALGLSIQLSEQGSVTGVAFANAEMAISIECEGHTNDTTYAIRGWKGQQSLQRWFSKVDVASFDMQYVALHLHRELNCHIRGFDLTSLAQSPKNRRPAAVLQQRVCYDLDRQEVDRAFDANGEIGYEDNCLRAWSSAILAEYCSRVLGGEPRVDTHGLTNVQLQCLGDVAKLLHLIEKDKPRYVQNDFRDIVTRHDGSFDLLNARYKNRVRQSTDGNNVIIQTSDGRSIIARATQVVGKRTTLQPAVGALAGKITNVAVVGKAAPSVSETARDDFVRAILRGEVDMISSPFIKLFSFPEPKPARFRPTKPTFSELCAEDKAIVSTFGLNDSQKDVVAGMLSDTMPVVIVHGPPGTGKTTTISASVKIWADEEAPVWIVAQSNVAVKNIAKSLHKRSMQFTLIVSKEFYVEWHEDLYESIQDRLVRTDDLGECDKCGTENLLRGSCVVLCTLGTLSNPVLRDSRLLEIVPLERLVVDEASQIVVFEYMHLFYEFPNLVKVCLFGDPKQLPPYGSETTRGLQSVFDLKQFKGLGYFLNTQYRMPEPVGDFISDSVYDSKMRSEHVIKRSDGSCIKFIDVDKGCEKQSGNSWTNLAEVQSILHTVHSYYRGKNFCILTPYDAQRTAIVEHLERERLPSDIVFNVDSFQGNEADYVIISVVRTDRIGFLHSIHRVNVMLTRCRRGMIIITNRNFVLGAARQTLLGQLAQHWQSTHDPAETWKDWRQVAEMRTSLPGVALQPKRSPALILTTRSQGQGDLIQPMSRLSAADGAVPSSGALLSSRKISNPTAQPETWKTVAPVKGDKRAKVPPSIARGLASTAPGTSQHALPSPSRSSAKNLAPLRESFPVASGTFASRPSQGPSPAWSTVAKGRNGKQVEKAIRQAVSSHTASQGLQRSQPAANPVDRLPTVTRQSPTSFRQVDEFPELWEPGDTTPKGRWQNGAGPTKYVRD